MTFALEYLERVARDDIPALSKPIRQRIKKAIETRLAIDPVAFGKPLQHTLKGYRRLRVGDYRVVYRIDENKSRIVIVAIAHRKAVYDMINKRSVH